MRIVVTGAAGFVGRRLLGALGATRHDVRAIDLRESDAPECVVGDVRAEADLAAVIRPGVDVVVHLAALTGVRPSLTAPEPYISTNVTGTLTVLQACQRAGVSRVVLASSSSVYGDTATVSREDDALVPLSPYAASKVAAEAVAASFANRGVLEVVVVRPFTVYGIGQRPDMAISTFLRQVRAGEPIRIWDFVRDFTYVDDVVGGIVGALTVPIPDGLRAYNLGSGRPVSAARLVAALTEVVGRQPCVVPVGRRPGEPVRTAAEPSRAVAELGFRRDTDLLDGLRRQLEHTGSVLAR